MSNFDTNFIHIQAAYILQVYILEFIFTYIFSSRSQNYHNSHNGNTANDQFMQNNIYRHAVNPIVCHASIA